MTTDDCAKYLAEYRRLKAQRKVLIDAENAPKVANMREDIKALRALPGKTKLIVRQLDALRQKLAILGCDEPS